MKGALPPYSSHYSTSQGVKGVDWYNWLSNGKIYTLLEIA